MSIETASEGSFSHMARTASKLMDQMQKGFFVYSPDTWTPNVNLYETAGSYFVCVDLAGADKEKIDIEVADQRLTLRGNRMVPSPEFLMEANEVAERKRGGAGASAAGATSAGSGGSSSAGGPAGDAEHGQKKAKLHLMEIDHGQFSREVELPSDANRESIAATYRNGMLWIEIPKK